MNVCIPRYRTYKQSIQSETSQLSLGQAYKEKINISDHEYYKQLQPELMNMGLPFWKSQELHQINTLQRHLLCY